MAELAMLADIQWTVCPDEVTCQLHFMAQPGKVRRSKTNILTTTTPPTAACNTVRGWHVWRNPEVKQQSLKYSVQT